MRLLHSKTLKLHEFAPNKIPAYAILSHTWREEEVSFQDLQAGRADGMRGFEKLRQTCRIASAHHLDFVWIDTCCIDKSSSAELSEAINSMFSWYTEANVCYAYLDDVPPKTDPRTPDSPFATCRWFSRGWTLQELIAPLQVFFYARDWTPLGTKHDFSKEISKITSIPPEILAPPAGNAKLTYIRSTSIAQRMSWASKRKTTRVEDIAYCLLGIFGVNMPLLYGEGSNAFPRLQEEIMKQSMDHSIFAFHKLNESRGGALAASPENFRYAGNVVTYRNPNVKPYSFTNKGILIDLPIFTPGEVGLHLPDVWRQEETKVAILSCHFENDFLQVIALKLSKVEGDLYEVNYPWRKCLTISRFKLSKLEEHVQTIYLASGRDRGTRLPNPHVFLVQRMPWSRHGCQLTRVYPPDCWNKSKRTIKVSPLFCHHGADSLVYENWCTVFLFEFSSGKSRGKAQRPFVLVFGFETAQYGDATVPFCKIHRPTQKSIDLANIWGKYTKKRIRSAPTKRDKDGGTRLSRSMDGMVLLVEIYHEAIMEDNVYSIDIYFQ